MTEKDIFDMNSYRANVLEGSEHRVQLQKVVDYYNKAQKFYETVWYRKALGLHYGFWTPSTHSRDEAIIEENKTLAEMASIKMGDHVLDAGCGVAGSSIWLAENIQAKVVAINIVQEQLKRAKKLISKNELNKLVNLANADYHKLPFPGESFDIFWSVESIEHSDNVNELIKESVRVLKPGGRTVIAGTFKEKTQTTDIQREQLRVGYCAAGVFIDFKSAEAIAELMKVNGYVNISNRNVTNLVMKSARQMRGMCELGLPGAKFGRKVNIVSQIMVDNTQWGVYQEELFKTGVTSYNVLIAQKP